MGDRWGDKQGRGGDKWGSRFQDERDRAPREPRSEELGKPQNNEPLRCCEIDALVFMQIMKHCRQLAPQTVTGQLLGLDVEDVLQVTHSFGYLQKAAEDRNVDSTEGEQYQMDTLRKLREVNVDSNCVGWYQTTHLGRFYSDEAIRYQYAYQVEFPRSVLIVYDSLQSAIGKPAFKALQLTPEFMKTYGESGDGMAGASLADFSSAEMFKEVPIVMKTSIVMEAFLVDWAISDPNNTTSQLATLDVENQGFLEKNIELLMHSLAELADEQQKLIQFERQIARKSEPQQKGGRDRFQRNIAQPRQLDTMILSQQIKNYCKAINGFAGDAFGKIYLMSNKPAGSA